LGQEWNHSAQAKKRKKEKEKKRGKKRQRKEKKAGLEEKKGKQTKEIDLTKGDFDNLPATSFFTLAQFHHEKGRERNKK